MKERLAIVCGVPMIACISEKLNLVIERGIDEQCKLSTVITTVREIMSQIRKLEMSACIRKLAHRWDVYLNDTKCTGKIYMMQRTLQIGSYLSSIPEPDDYLPLHP